MKHPGSAGTFIAVLIGSVFAGNALADEQAAPSAQTPDRIDVRLLSDPQNPWTEPSTIIGVLGVLGGITGVLIQRLWHLRDERRSAERADRDRLQAHVLDSLKWFEGKTQKRSIGIAVVEGNWNKFAELRLTWLAVLTNQAIYLLAESGQDDAAHERSNLNRMMTLLSQTESSVSPDQRKSLVDAIDKNIKGAGLRGIDRTLLDGWRSRFGPGNVTV
jgi:hypothetical protein